jgi:pyridoxine 5-phosphate synthase
MAQCKLSVNVNKIATLRNSRGGNIPNLLQVVSDLIDFGAEGITVHPRPDERHIKYQDVFDISRFLKKYNKDLADSDKVEFNIEGYPNPSFLKLVLTVIPDQVTLVPDPPDAITSNAGWKVHKNKNFLKHVIQKLHKSNIRVSLFIDPATWSKQELDALLDVNTDRVELYTEKYAQSYPTKKRKLATDNYKKVATEVWQRGIFINAGHDLNSENLFYLLKQIPSIIEVSIGHALISDSLYHGLKKTIEIYSKEINRANSTNSRTDR